MEAACGRFKFIQSVKVIHNQKLIIGSTTLGLLPICNFSIALHIVQP